MDTRIAPTATTPKKDSMVKPYKLSHGTLMCGDMKKSRQFYEEFLGLEVVRHTKPAMMFRLTTGMHVVAVECSPDKLWDMHVLHHWGVDVATKEEVDEAYKKAQEHRETYGIRKITKPINQHGVYSFYLQDLDKNWWEIQYAPNQHEACFARGDVMPMA
jgi:catechol 2,3-dioxygenase-like lactoylglutathione lyase family enzyme